MLSLQWLFVGGNNVLRKYLSFLFHESQITCLRASNSMKEGMVCESLFVIFCPLLIVSRSVYANDQPAAVDGVYLSLTALRVFINLTN